MVRVQLIFDQGTPQYACDSCSNCQSVLGKSLCSMENRGCCWYFPKFTLHELHKLSKSKEGLEILNHLMGLPKIKIYNYYLLVMGYFDELGYKKHLKSEQASYTDGIDKTIFFRACPFVEPGVGCTLPEKYRSYVCNFYICDEIINALEKHHEFKYYVKERNSFVKWVEWENQSLEMLLREKRLNLVNNFNEVINLLRDVPLESYEFPNLDPIEVSN